MKEHKFLPLLLMLFCVAVVGALTLSGVIDLRALPQAVEDRYALALFLVFALFALKGISAVILYDPLIIAVSLIFPLPEALCINAVGTAVTLSVSYLIGASMGAGGVERLLQKSEKLRRHFTRATKYGFVFCFAVHTLGLSMEVLGILFGMLRIGFVRYLVSSWLGIMPGMVCFTLAGGTLDFRSPLFWIAAGVDAACILFGILFTRCREKRERTRERQ